MPDVGPAGTDPDVLVPGPEQGLVQQIQAEQAAGVATRAAARPLADALVDSPPAPAGDTGGFRFSPEEIEPQLARCEQLIDALNRDQLLISQLGRASAPAPDEAGSVAHIEALAAFGAELEKRNRALIQYLRWWSGRLIGAMRDYLRCDDVAASERERLTDGMPR